MCTVGCCALIVVIEQEWYCECRTFSFDVTVTVLIAKLDLALTTRGINEKNTKLDQRGREQVT